MSRILIPLSRVALTAALLLVLTLGILLLPGVVMKSKMAEASDQDLVSKFVDLQTQLHGDVCGLENSEPNPPEKQARDE
ncbi:MAG: hypothetical protein AB8B94_14220 [Hyphomicrobiales bacterium]